MTDTNCSIDLQTRYRISDRSELVTRISLCLAEELLLDDPRQAILRVALHMRVGFQSLYDRTDGALLLLAEDQGIIDELLESSILREVDLPPLLEWMENQLKGGS